MVPTGLLLVSRTWAPTVKPSACANAGLAANKAAEARATNRRIGTFPFDKKGDLLTAAGFPASEPASIRRAQMPLRRWAGNQRPLGLPHRPAHRRRRQQRRF